MDNAAEKFLGAGVEFPTIPVEQIPEDSVALGQIIAGELALTKFYSDLQALLPGEVRCLATLIQRDFERNFRGLRREVEAVFRSAGGNGTKLGPLPRAEQIDRVVRGLVGEPPETVIDVAVGFASRALLCYQMVPWVSPTREVDDHLKARLEAEDRHLAVLQLFSELVKGS